MLRSTLAGYQPSPLQQSQGADSYFPPYDSSPSAVTFPTSDYDAFDALLHNIYDKTLKDNYFKDANDADETGVCLRIESNSKAGTGISSGDEGPSTSTFRVFPYDNPALVPFLEGIQKLNPAAAVKLKGPGIWAAIRGL
jgi:hypothetical protein